MEAVFALLKWVNWKSLLLTSTRIGLILLLALLVLKLLRRLFDRVERHLVERGLPVRPVTDEIGKRVSTLMRLLRQGASILVWAIAGLVVLRELGVEIGPILASAGIVGLAVGFGAQNLVKDVIAGFFMILEDQVRVGDVAVINGTSGLVEQINFRTIVLRDLAGVVHVFPNGTINTLSNMTHEWSAYVFEIGVAYKEDTDKVIAILKEVGSALRDDDNFGAFLLEDIEVFGLDQFADSAVVLKGRLKTRPGKQWETGREFRRRVKLAFDAQGIEIPFPQRTLHLKQEPSHEALLARQQENREIP